ncbi:MAG: HAD hydrolase family protein [Rhodospirillum sp.]|nr:HAD hydrolase family protein [Rhodospirillum sp.]MCF8488099.1 HAD hydrolase family protein [Rhodospirillum sp.]MCF8501575.1 HAD hydrolase family protein [Rhodospirillum sp.]
MTVLTPVTPPSDPDLIARIRGLRLLVFDFDGVFTANTVHVFEDGREAVTCSRLDGYGLRRVTKTGIECMILSTEVNPVVAARAAKLKIQATQGVENKLPALKTLCAERNIGLEAVAYVGNDINDLDCLRAVGLPIVVRDGHPDVMEYARYVTQWLGGRGAVREVCDSLARVRETEPQSG